MKLEVGGNWRVTPDEVAAAFYNYTSDAFFRSLLQLKQVDAGHIYGDSLDRQLNLRLLKDGKLKYQVKSFADLYLTALLGTPVQLPLK